jgi:preprotein translocase subunit YajC
MIIRPQRRREQQVQQMLNALQKGDRVITSSGIHGEIDSLDRDTLVLEIAPKVKVTIQRSAIVALSEARRTPITLSENTSEEDTSPSKTLKKKKK